MDTERSSTYWATAVIVVIAITVAVWWYTAVDTGPLVPNTGATSSAALEYDAQ